MLFTRNLSAAVAGITICANVLAGNPANAQINSQVQYGSGDLLQQTEFERRGDAPILIAHHEGASGAAALGADLGAVQVLSTNGDGGGSGSLTDSLWGNLLLQMACSRDKQLKSSAKKLKLTENLTLAGVYGISGLSLAQSIAGLATLNPTASEPAPHEHGEHEAAHSHSEGSVKQSSVPGILGLVSSGSTLVTLGARFYYGRKYGKQISRRQKELVHKVEHLLSELESGTDVESLHEDFSALVGERATREFSQLWRATHVSVAVAGASG